MRTPTARDPSIATTMAKKASYFLASIILSI
jgi:hypothetical protein